MNDREKLADMMIELKGYLEEIYEFPTLDFFLKELAMQLIANGVTFATDNNDGGKWISVTERLPENICPVLVALEGISTAFNGWYHDGKWWTVGAGTRPFTQKVTHWMPLPKPPKGENE